MYTFFPIGYCTFLISCIVTYIIPYITVLSIVDSGVSSIGDIYGTPRDAYAIQIPPIWATYLTSVSPADMWPSSTYTGNALHSRPQTSQCPTGHSGGRGQPGSCYSSRTQLESLLLDDIGGIDRMSRKASDASGRLKISNPQPYQPPNGQ